jgi:formyl-CoA transferase
VPYQVFACADGHLILAVGNDGQFAKFCEAAGVAAWAADPRFARNADRVRHRDTLVPLVAEVVKAKRQHEWLALLEPLGVPCGPINPIDQVFDEPQLHARGMRLDLPHPLAGSVPQVGFPLLLDRERSDAAMPPPLLGQHTREVLKARLGYDDAWIADLATRGVVAT